MLKLSAHWFISDEWLLLNVFWRDNNSLVNYVPNLTDKTEQRVQIGLRSDFVRTYITLNFLF